MKIDYLKYKNFFSTGNDGIEIDFSKYGNLILIHGINKDIEADDDDDEAKHSNAAGKSTLSHALFYGLYGEFLREGLDHPEAINNTTNKDLEVEVIFELNNTYYRIIRRRKPNELLLWESKEKIWDKNTNQTLGGIPATQKAIDKILKLNHQAFTNIVFFGQHNKCSFLDCNAKDKRAIAESLLSLDVFQLCADRTKEEIKEIKRNLKDATMQYESSKNEEAFIEKRLFSIKNQEKLWLNTCLDQIEQYRKQIKILYDDLPKTETTVDTIEYKKNIAEYEEKINELAEKKSIIENTLDEANNKFNEYKIKAHQGNMEIASIKKELIELNNSLRKVDSDISDLQSLKPGVKCDSCFGIVDSANYKHILTLKKNNKQSIEEKISNIDIKKNKQIEDNSKIEQIISKIKDACSNAESKIKYINDVTIQIHKKISELSKIESQTSSKEALSTQKIEQLLLNIKTKEDEIEYNNPYSSLIKSTKEELQSKIDKSNEYNKKITEIELAIPYYEWWQDAFINHIRSFIIGGILPSLNERISYWLHLLLNGKMTLTFNNKLEPIIRNNPPDKKIFAYKAMSGGVKNRIDLAIALSFADVMMISSGTTPSVLFLDEIGSDFDIKGRKQIYKMIMKLVEMRQVFIITHDPILLNMINDCDHITVKLENGLTTKIENDDY